jgi:hypothetical protein
VKRILVLVLALIFCLALATPAFAGEGKDYMEQPGYSQASDSGQAHGAFGYFGADTNLGVNSLGPGTPTYHGGAVGQDPGATGYNNSHVNGNPP